MKNGRRSDNRYNAILTMSFRVLEGNGHIEESACSIFNLSQNGILFESTKKISERSILYCVIDGEEKQIAFQGICVYSRNTPNNSFENGIYIQTLPPADKRKYNAMMLKLEASHKVSNAIRPEIQYYSNVAMRVSAEHKILSGYLSDFKRISKANFSKENLGSLMTIFTFLLNDLTTHYNIEEKIIFKISKKGLDEKHTPLIDQLTSEHSFILKEGAEIYHILLQYDQMGQKPDVGLQKRISDFFDVILHHSKKEITDLFPVIDKNKSVNEKILKVIKDIADA